jgi:hypothetical protein
MYSYVMDLYTLSSEFLIQYKIERYSSLIWTERYSSAGDFSLVVPPTPQLIRLLRPGCYLGLRGRREVMIVESQSFDSGLLTVTGSSLVKFLNQRISWFKNPDYDHTDSSSPLYADYSTDDQTHGEFISDVVNKVVIDPPAFDSPYDDIALDWGRDKISQLSLAHIDHVGVKKKLTFPNGSPLYDGVEQLAGEGHVGISMYLGSANFATREFFLRFTTYHGRDKTSDQNHFPTIRFTPKTESMSDPKELRSISEFKNVAYVSYKGKITKHYSPYVESPPVGFRRRVLYVEAPDVKVSDAKRAGFLQRVADQEFRKQLHTHVIDGQVLGYLTEFKYPVHYYLGDIVEIEGHSGMIIKARVAEYVRSQDQNGVKEYPTFEILAEDETNYASDQTFDPDTEDPIYSISRISSGLRLSTPLEDSVRDPLFVGDDPFPDPQGFTEVPDSEYPGGGPILSGHGLKPLTPWQTPDWNYNQSDVGYYVHSGRVYLFGTVTAGSLTSGPTLVPGSDTILTNIPPEYAPAGTATGRVLVDHSLCTYEYAYDSGLKIGPWLPVTISPDGNMTLDDGNPLRTPADPSVDFTWIGLILSDISWPTNDAVYDAYGDTGSLDEYVGTAAHVATEFLGTVPEDIWNNIDGSYSAHDERLHFNGKVKVVGDYAAYPIDALIGIPVEYQVKQSSESATGFVTLAEMAQKDGYRLNTYVPAGGGHRALEVGSGAQNPAAAGNSGCGFFDRYFYERVSDGFLTRGEATTLSFTPAPADVGVAYSGAKGRPVGDLPDVADWKGNVYDVDFIFTIDDLLTTLGPVGFPIDYTLIHGDGQLAFIMGMTPGLASPDSYYKVVLTYDPAFERAYMHLMLEQCGGTGRAVLASHSWAPGVSHSTPIGAGFSLITSPEPGDVGFTGTPIPGWNYWSWVAEGALFVGSDFIGTPLGGGSPIPAGKTKGDMGFHFPSGSTANIRLADIAGLGSFPVFAEGDILDLTGCGWPLT